MGFVGRYRVNDDNVLLFVYGCVTALFSKAPLMHTVRRELKVPKWTLEALWEGKHPASDAFGNRYAANTPEGMRARTPLCGDGDEHYFAFPFVIRGDL